MNKLICEKCAKELKKSDIIILVKDNGMKVVDVLTSCRGKCHDELERERESQGYRCGFYEMNTKLKDNVLLDDFSKSMFKGVTFNKYEAIVKQCND